MIPRICALMVFALIAATGASVSAADRKVYFYGNSLIHHLGDSDETAVPHWLALMAQEAGHGFRANGQWGFLRDFARAGPVPNWSFHSVKSAWDSDRQPFEAVDWDAIVINPANFIQYQPADAPYDGDNPDATSPLAALLDVIDRHPGLPVLIYEGWSEMKGGYPPSRRGFRKFNAYNRGAYHEWYVDLVEGLKQARAGRDIRLIPVAKLLSEMFAEGPMAQVSPERLFVDVDPHGTASTYFLAAMVLYTALYGETAPVGMTLSESLEPELRRAYPLLAVSIGTKMKDLQAAFAPEQHKETPAVAEAPPDLTGTQGLADPGLAMGLNGIADWSTQQPFIDVMKTARPWLGHEGENWGAWNAKRLGEEGYLDDHGWVKAMPPGVDRIETFLLTDQDKAAVTLAGRYRVRWQGKGKLRIGGRGRNGRQDGNEAWFDYAPGSGEVAITLTKIDPDDPIRNIEIVREDQIALHELGVVFNPDWIARIADLRLVRFMDWMLTNGSPVTSWETRPMLADFSYGWRGVPVELMIELANQIGADPWFCMPHGADDGYSRAFAEMVKARLDLRLKAYVEFSNELWNFSFPQAHWAAAQADAAWGAEGDAWMQFAGRRAAEIMQVWSAVFGAEAAERLVRVVAVHTGWTGLEEPLLEAPLWVREQGPGGRKPVEFFDAYAVSGYFGFEMGTAEEGRLPEVRQWLAESREAAEKPARAKGLQRKALEAAIAPVRFDLAVPRAVQAMREGSLKELSETLWPYHAGVARRYGLELVMYEGGSHVTGHGAAVQDDELTAFFTYLNYTPEMAGLYEVLLHRWAALSGGPFNAFVDVARATQHGSWGALRHLSDDNPRWRALMAANAVGPGRVRAPGTFVQGVMRQGGAGGETLEGSIEEDILLGGDGDDVLIALGGSDYLDGGPGQDVARLAGAREDYTFAMQSGRLLAVSDAQEVRIRGIEFLEFQAEPGRQYRLDLPD